MFTYSCLTVTLNPTIDVSTSVRQLINHQKLRCESPLEQVGGGGLNVSTVLQSLGTSCQSFWPKGGIRGEQILSELDGDGIHSLTTSIKGDNRQCFTVYETVSGHEYRFVLPGPTLSEYEQQECVTTIVSNLPSDFLILSGSLPGGIDAAFYAQIITAAKRAQPDLKIVIDTSSESLAHALNAGVFLFKPSREEFCELTRHEAQTPELCVNACRDLIMQGKSQVVALTMGAEGSLVVSADEAWLAHPLPVKVTSTVGAGDSYVGGFVHAIMCGQHLQDAARLGTAAAAAALQTQGKLAFDPELINALASQVQIESLGRTKL